MVQTFTPEVARSLIQLRADPELQARMDELAEKCNEGRLTAEEREEYETSVRFANYLAIIERRRLLKASECPDGRLDTLRWSWARAQCRCEYCRIHQDDEPFYRMHVEHIVAKQHGGSDNAAEPRLACHHDNDHKGPNLSGIDPAPGKVVCLFHPRRQRWSRHFRFQGPVIVGRAKCGRATVAALALNAPDRVELRAELIAAGVFPQSPDRRRLSSVRIRGPSGFVPTWGRLGPLTVAIASRSCPAPGRHASG